MKKCAHWPITVISLWAILLRNGLKRQQRSKQNMNAIQTLRPYQKDALNSTLDALRQGPHPVIAHPTGGGKGILCAALCATLPGRIAVLSHRQELLKQNAEKLHALCPTESWGIYSAGLERRDKHQRVIFGGVQSVYERMASLQ